MSEASFSPVEEKLQPPPLQRPRQVQLQEQQHQQRLMKLEQQTTLKHKHKQEEIEEPQIHEEKQRNEVNHYHPPPPPPIVVGENGWKQQKPSQNGRRGRERYETGRGRGNGNYQQRSKYPALQQSIGSHFIEHDDRSLKTAKWHWNRNNSSSSSTFGNTTVVKRRSDFVDHWEHDKFEGIS